MRLIKLRTDQVFPTYQLVERYFASELPGINGKFHFHRNGIAKDGLETSELLLFSYQGNVVRLANAASGRIENDDKYHVQYPHYFLIDMGTVREVNFSLADLEDQMRKKCGVTKTIATGRAWVRLPDTPDAIKTVEKLAGGD